MAMARMRRACLASAVRVGVLVLAYAGLHLALYILNQHFDLPHVASEILSRIYLAIGFIAFCGLCALGATSTDGIAPLIQVLAANLDFSYAARPCWYVLGAGLMLFMARLARPWMASGKASSLPSLRRSRPRSGAGPL
jgi:hypothetical protein